MNELIAQFAEQAAQDTAGEHNEVNLEVECNGSTFHIPGNFIEQFADLLVQECVRIGQKEFVNDSSKYPVFPSVAIKKHFGVEQ